MKSTIDALLWRYATKKYNSAKKLSAEQLNAILEAVRLSPASYGLQSFRVVVVDDPAKRAKLREAAYGQPQLTDASHLLVFAIRKDLSEKDVDEYIEEVSKVRGLPAEQLKGYGDMIKGAVTGRDSESRQNWAARQAYIALGVLLTVAAVEGVDATPMEGFDPAAFDRILNLEEKGLKSVVVAALGFRDESDDYLKMKKVRLPKEKLFIKL